MSKITNHQKKELIDFMKSNYNFLEGRFKSGQGSLNKENVWAELSAKLNSCGPAKSPTQWQKCWTDLKSAVRKKFRQLTAECQKTGGGVVDPKFELDEDQNAIFEICGVDYFAGDNKTNEVGFGVETVRVVSTIENNEESEPRCSKRKTEEVEHAPTKKLNYKPTSNVVELALEESKKTNELLQKMIALQEIANTKMQALIDVLSPNYL